MSDIPQHILCKCYRQLLESLSSTDSVIFSKEANDFRTKIINPQRDQYSKDIFFWERSVGDLLFISYDGTYYYLWRGCIWKQTNRYHLTVGWREEDLFATRHGTPLWPLLCEMSLSILGKDLNTTAHNLIQEENNRKL